MIPRYRAWVLLAISGNEVVLYTVSTKLSNGVADPAEMRPWLSGLKYSALIFCTSRIGMDAGANLMRVRFRILLPFSYSSR
jgi:hypothetical protein